MLAIARFLDYLQLRSSYQLLNRARRTCSSTPSSSHRTPPARCVPSMGWEWRVFYNIRRDGAGGEGQVLSQSLPVLLGLGPLLPENDPRTDAYYLLDFPLQMAPSTGTLAAVDPITDPAPLPPHPRTVGLKLRGGTRAGLEIKCLLDKKPNLGCEKWKKFPLEPEVQPSARGVQGVNQGSAEHAQLLRTCFANGLSKFLPLEHVTVIGLAKISKQRSQRTLGGVLVEHTLLRLESDAVPGVVVLAESFGLDGKKAPLEQFLKSKGVREAANVLQGLVMSYPELLHQLFVEREMLQVLDPTGVVEGVLG